MSSDLRLKVSASELDERAVVITGDRYHYLARVRRAAVGDAVELFDGHGRRRAAVISFADSESMTLTPSAPALVAAEARGKQTSIVPLIKGDRMDFAIAKLTELGVVEIRVVRCERSVVTLDEERARRRIERLERVAADAARQCRRDDIPRLPAITSFADAARSVEASLTGAIKLVFHPQDGESLRSLVRTWDDSGHIVLATGPEGGFTAKEISLAHDAGFVVASLGPRVLRAETASIAALAAVSALHGDLGGLRGI